MTRVILSLIIYINISVSYSADGVGNGGGAWSCINSNNSVRWVKFTDLFEAQEEFLLRLKKFGAKRHEDYIKEIKKRIFKINKDFYKIINKELNSINKHVNFIDNDLEEIKDALVRIRPDANECISGSIKYIQVANYTPYDKLLINKKIFFHTTFSERDKAALFLHEAIYKYLRDNYSDKNSLRTREIVGLIFSDLKAEIVREKINRILNYKKVESKFFKFSKILKGEAVLGSLDDEPKKESNEALREVQITKNFEMLRYEVTQDLFFEITGHNPSHFNGPLDCPESFDINFEPKTGKSLGICVGYPVENLNYMDIQMFLRLLNSRTGKLYRLPTESEWEYAARAGSKDSFHFGSNSEELTKYSIFKNTSIDQKTMKIGPLRNVSNLPNNFDLYDMHGNVSEWTSDKYIDFPKGGIDPIGPTSGNERVIKGGNYLDEWHNLRSARRRALNDWHNKNYIGFRIVREL